MLLLVSWYVTWPLLPDDFSTQKNARNFWIAINGDITNRRYGMLGQDNTGLQYKVPSFYNADSYWGGTGQASQTVIKLNANEYFSIWCWHNSEAAAIGQFSIGGGDPVKGNPIGAPTFYPYNNQETLYSVKLTVARLDG
jgi:hypothetical protein